MRTCVIDLPGLSARLLDRLDASKRPAWLTRCIDRGRGVIEPVMPAVTMPAHATYTTGVTPAEHGVVANGVASYRDADIQEHLDLDSYPDYRANVSFWEQSNQLVTAPRVWSKPGSERSDDRDVAMLFFQSSIRAADVVVTPKPTHTPDGKTIPDCWTEPRELNKQLQEKLGMFPLMHYWGPMANLLSSQWIAACAEHVWAELTPELCMTYVPHLDYDLQRFGPSSDKVVGELAAVLAVLTPLAERVEADGGRVVVLSDYGITDVSRSVAPNALLRDAGLLTLTERGEVDYRASAAFAMCDHQVAHVYVTDASRVDEVVALLRGRDEIASLHVGDERGAIGLDTPRAGDIVAFTHEDAWFEYRWWDSFDGAPDYAWAVDIHRKPGYDPTELFMDFETRRIRADQPQLVKGSHGARPADHADWPVLLGVDAGEVIPATDVAALLQVRAADEDHPVVG